VKSSVALVALPVLLLFLALVVGVPLGYAARAKRYADPLQEEKSIAACILLSFVTFGIYQICWIHSICKKIKVLNGEDPSCAGEVCLILFIPFYNIYWMFTRGKKLAEAANRRGIPLNDNSIIYLVLSLFGLNIVNYALLQNDLNAVARAYGGDGRQPPQGAQ
jgi:hypothetical protein